MSTITRRRLFGVLAHVDAGKTTVSERLLFTSGRIHRQGEVHHGNTTLDHTDEEEARHHYQHRGHHHHVAGAHPLVHRHPGTHRLRHRGRAVLARTRRRGGRARRLARGRAPDRERLAASRASSRTALKKRGIQPLLEAVVHYLPSPEERPLPEGLTVSATAPLCAFVFKTEVDAHTGTLAWVRVFQGTVRPGEALVLRPAGTAERVSRVLGLHGAKFEPLESLEPGGIAALVGLRSAPTGNTLCATGGPAIVLEGVCAADPVVELALSTRSAEEQARLRRAP